MNMMNSQEGGYRPNTAVDRQKEDQAAVMLPAICTSRRQGGSHVLALCDRHDFKLD
jgi:hypothetical protein